MDKILVTGSAGLIGSALTQKLRSNGYEVIDCDIRFVNNPLSFFSEEIRPVLNKCTGIIHLAAIARVIHGEQYPELCKQVNVDGTKKFLKFYEKLSHKPWLIYGSSREVYGNQDNLPVVESANFNPVNVYAKGKVEIENAVKALGTQGFNTLILRFSNVYGGLLDHNDRVIPALCINALNNDTIRIDGKECVFDFTYIEDVVEGILLTVKKMRNLQKIELPIHFTGCRGCSLEELVKIILKITDSKSSIDYRLPRNFDVTSFYGDFSNAQKLLGWKPKHSLEEGIEKFVLNIQNEDRNCPYNVEMEIYEDIKSYSWLPALL
ncbi:NAD-dependent epimerase/dehydratase [Candidatus Phycorickettsia trachydisci]|uniref:NAD-dependent epimerase/dehydratase n=1 Tax=Candidatus Phycorickettsia trachydisci TaxID=2115978 RepID=A0A2P1P9I5_9RICK|nr:NAD(P)-dependent oxidoreductase [Candidatus Phycorickettsia trachydisci]AVP87927.1 NAD-dependent epimerase/dehydratase [Candidatus Phycorickettsia trachydisci]